MSRLTLTLNFGKDRRARIRHGDLTVWVELVDTLGRDVRLTFDAEPAVVIHRECLLPEEERYDATMRKERVKP